MEDRISIRLTGPAKIDGKWRKPGDVVEVTRDTLRELASAGAADGADDLAIADLAAGTPGYDEAVATMARTLVDAEVEAAINAALGEVVAERDAARTRAADAEDAHRRAEARALELEAELHEVQTALEAATTETATPAEDEATQLVDADTAPETAPKKGARAKKG